MAGYDPRILQQFADLLYTKARAVVINYSVLGLLVGGGVGLGIKLAFHASRDTQMVGTIAWIGLAAIGLYGGYTSGQMKAFALRLDAQRTLCQLQIEENTRKTSKPDDHDLLKPINIKG